MCLCLRFFYYFDANMYCILYETVIYEKDLTAYFVANQMEWKRNEQKKNNTTKYTVKRIGEKTEKSQRQCDKTAKHKRSVYCKKWSERMCVSTHK